MIVAEVLLWALVVLVLVGVLVVGFGVVYVALLGTVQAVRYARQNSRKRVGR
ncbi:hypothetical protein ACWGH5_09770 [Streptomyces sp. NPDC054864]